ncbi:putative uncharacterized protein DDB_G0282133 [Hydra vulgaris]|uniref:putative uncharacterized protein DDB_G0282133 n=1 Tax=Hydra vulgaris TaxID=6087 RepID=UPI0006412C23|nr:putative uncharacterized protein DDB_G0282133 [Hydra vulgaris]
MDVKFIIAVIIALAVVFLLMSEISSLKTIFEKKINEIDSVIEKHNDDLKTILKKEMTKNSEKYISYTNDMLQQMRKMNSVERQTVMASDHFIEGGYVDQNMINNKNYEQIPYLSDMNQTQYSNIVKTHNNDSGFYMSTTSDADTVFVAKDEKNNILQSAKISDSNITDNSTHDKSKSKKNTQVNSKNHSNFTPNVLSNESSKNTEGKNIAHNQYKLSDKAISDNNKLIKSDKNKDNDKDNDDTKGLNNKNEENKIENNTNSGSEDNGSEENESEDNGSEENDSEENESEDSGSENDEFDNTGSKDNNPKNDKSINNELNPIKIGDNDVNIKQTLSKTDKISKKLQKLKKLQASMQSDDDNSNVSNDITIGSLTKGINMVAKTGSSKQNKDDISIVTAESSQKKLKSMGSYTKDDLIKMAQLAGIVNTGKMTKQTLYDALKRL